MSKSKVRTALVIRADQVTVVTARTTATGKLTELKALVKQAKAGGQTVIVTPDIERVTEKYPGENAALPQLLKMRLMQNNVPYAGLIYTNASGRVALIENVDIATLARYQNFLKGSGLVLTEIVGTLEAAARHNPEGNSIVADRNGPSGAWGVTAWEDPESAVSYVTSLKPGNTLEEIVMGGIEALQQSNGLPRIVLSGTFTVEDQLFAQNLSGQEAVLLDDAALGRCALDPLTPGGLGSLFLIPAKSSSDISLSTFYLPIGAAVAFGLASFALSMYTGTIDAQTAGVNDQDHTLAPVLQQVRTLKRANDTLQTNLTNAENLSRNRGVLSGDVLAIAQRVSTVQGAALSALRGPELANDLPSYDGQTVIANYTLNAHTTSRQAAEALIASFNQAPYAANTRTLTCKDGACTVDVTIGLLKRDVIQ
jgi:hypothetical protein